MDYSGQGPVYPSKPALTLVLLQVRHPASPGFFLTCQCQHFQNQISSCPGLLQTQLKETDWHFNIHCC